MFLDASRVSSSSVSTNETNERKIKDLKDVTVVGKILLLICIQSSKL